MTSKLLIEKITKFLDEIEEVLEEEEKKKKSTIKLILEALESIESLDELKLVRSVLKELLEGKTIIIEFGIGDGISSNVSHLYIEGLKILGTTEDDEYKESLIGAVYGFLENLANAGLIKHKREENYPYEEHIFWI